MEAKKNIKTVKLILTAEGLRKFKTIPTFKNSLHPNQINNLHVGTNELNVNHYTSGKLKQIAGYDSDNMQIKEQLNKENIMKLQELKQLIKECYNDILQENGIDYTQIADVIYKNIKHFGTEWENHAKAECKSWNLTKDETKNIMDILRSEDYFDTGEIEFESRNIHENAKSYMNKTELIKLIKECHGEILKEFAPEPNAHDEDEYTSDIDDKKFKTNKALDKAKEKLDKVNKAITDKFADYKANKCTPEAYIAFFKEKSKLRKELETELHDLI